MKSKIKKPLVSVIIPSYNSRSYIMGCLHSLINQHTTLSYEIIVVDSSKDDTPTIIKKNFSSVKLISLKNRTFPGAARNIGVKKSRGKIIVFIDSDCIAAQDWLENGIHTLQQGYSFVGGAVKNANPGFISTADYILTFNEFFPTMPSRRVSFMPSCNFMCHKDTFEKVGGFDPSLLAGEDTVFCYKAKKNYPLFFNATMNIAHHNRSTFKKFLTHHYFFGKYSAVIRKQIMLPGSLLARNPLLVLIIPLGRFLKILFRFLTKNRNLLGVFLLNLPLISGGILIWGVGFISGSLTEHNVYKFPVMPNVNKYER